MILATTPHSVQQDTPQLSWDRIAAGYNEFVTPSHFWLGDQGLERVGLEPGMHFLDVAAGSGALSVPAARRGADVLATDASARMLEKLQARASSEQLPIETRVMDGQALALDEASVDIAGSQFGVMLFPDMPCGIREMARVVRPGGKVLVTAYGSPQQIDFLQFFVAAIQQVVPGFSGPPTDPPPLPFQLQDPARLRAELERAGLCDVQVDTITEELNFESGEQLWAWLTNSNPIVGEILGELSLTPAKTARIRHHLDQLIETRAGGASSAVLTNPINIGVGSKR